MAWDDEDEAPDDWNDDPQECDLDPDEADDPSELATAVCRRCGSEIVAGLPQCPRCGVWSPEEAGRAGGGVWAVVALAVVLAIAGLYAVGL